MEENSETTNLNVQSCLNKSLPTDLRSKYVVPGDDICTFDEAKMLSGPGTFIDFKKNSSEKLLCSSKRGKVLAELENGKFFITVQMESEREKEDKTASPPCMNDVILGEVLMVGVDRVLVSILARDGKFFDRRYLGIISNNDIIPIRDVEQTQKLKSINPALYFGANDIILAKIISGREPYQLSCKEDRRCGVLMAYSPESFRPLVPISFKEMAEGVTDMSSASSGVKRYFRLVSPVIADTMVSAFQEVCDAEKKVNLRSNKRR